MVDRDDILEVCIMRISLGQCYVMLCLGVGGREEMAKKGWQRRDGKVEKEGGGGR